MVDPLQSDLSARTATGLALIFDMDGVILNSNPIHCEAWRVFNRGYGLETSDAMVEWMYGRRNDEIVRGFFGADLPEAENAARGAAKERLYREMMTGRVEEHLTPGLREFLNMQSAIPKAVASNAEPENVAFVLDEAGLRSYFRAVVDGHQVSRPKPSPDVFLRASALLGVHPRNCIVFEDSYSGVAAARAAGMRVVGIRSSHDELPGADLAADDFRDGELHSWLLAQVRSL